MRTVSALLITISSSPITIRYKNNDYVLNGINSVALPHKFCKPDSIFFYGMQYEFYHESESEK